MDNNKDSLSNMLNKMSIKPPIFKCKGCCLSYQTLYELNIHLYYCEAIDNMCQRCGRSNHFSQQCNATTNVDGYKI
jgi:hypothetical protein